MWFLLVIIENYWGNLLLGMFILFYDYGDVMIGNCDKFGCLVKYGCDGEMYFDVVVVDWFFFEDYIYNDWNELVFLMYMFGDVVFGIVDFNCYLSYLYDLIGNCMIQMSLVDVSYKINEFNQYYVIYQLDLNGDEILGVLYKYDEDGNFIELYLFGDFNCDGKVSVFDIDLFVMVIVDLFLYEQIYLDCDCFVVDFNGSGIVDGFDINFMMLFVFNSRSNKVIVVMYGYDVENCLIFYGLMYFDLDSVKVEFDYDY